MKRKNFVTLILGTIGGMLFSLGMCMGLIAEWNAFIPGVILGVAGVAVLLVMLAVRRKMEGKPPVKLNGRNIARVVYGIVSALVLGTGMCMTAVWDGLMVPGIILGIAGIAMLIGLFPIIKGIKD